MIIINNAYTPANLNTKEHSVEPYVNKVILAERI